MESLKRLSLTVLAAAMVIVAVCASSAMAENTTLCRVDENPCHSENQVSHVHVTTLSGAKATLLNSISNVLCDVLFLGEVQGATLANPLLIVGNFTYSNCVDHKPNTCTVKEESSSAEIAVLKEGTELAKVTGEALVKVSCSGISCRYIGPSLVGHALGPLTSSELNGQVDISEQTVLKDHVSPGLLCPSTAKLDITVTPLEKIYISS